MGDMQEIADCLSKGEDAEWDLRNKMMVKLQELAKAGASKWDCYSSSFEKVKKPLAAQVLSEMPIDYFKFYKQSDYNSALNPMKLKDLRSQVIKEVCGTIIVLATTLRASFDPHVNFFFCKLLRLTAIKTQAMSKPAHEALLSIVKSVSLGAALEPVLEQSTAKSPIERARCVEYLAILLDGREREGWEALERQKDSIANMIQVGMADASPDARSLARACFWKFYNHWQDKGKSLMETLDSATQRALTRDANSSSAPKDQRSAHQPKRRTNLPPRSGSGFRAMQQPSMRLETSMDESFDIAVPANPLRNPAQRISTSVKEEQERDRVEEGGLIPSPSYHKSRGTPGSSHVVTLSAPASTITLFPAVNSTVRDGKPSNPFRVPESLRQAYQGAHTQSQPQQAQFHAQTQIITPQTQTILAPQPVLSTSSSQTPLPSCDSMGEIFVADLNQSKPKKRKRPPRSSNQKNRDITIGSSETKLDIQGPNISSTFTTASAEHEKVLEQAQTLCSFDPNYLNKQVLVASLSTLYPLPASVSTLSHAAHETTLQNLAEVVMPNSLFSKQDEVLLQTGAMGSMDSAFTSSCNNATVATEDHESVTGNSQAEQPLNQNTDKMLLEATHSENEVSGASNVSSQVILIEQKPVEDGTISTRYI